jgi:hypothetical protein
MSNKSVEAVAWAEVDDMRWIDVAVTNKEAFIVNCDEGFREHLNGIWWEDNFQIDAPIHLPTGVYRWQQFKIGFWQEDDGMNVTDGEFVPYTLPEVAALTTQHDNTDLIAGVHKPSAVEVDFMQALLDRYGESGNLVDLSDWPGFMAVVRKHLPRLQAADALQASPRELRDIPRDIAELALKLGEVEWGATAEKVAAEHVADFTETLRLTRENFDLADIPVQLQGLYLKGTETVVCHTGTSPNSATIARTLAGLWNTFLADARTALDQG